MENYDADGAVDYARGKRNVIAASLVFTILSCGFSFRFDDNPQAAEIVSLCTAVGYGLLILMWCKIDSNQRGENLGAGFRFLVVIFGVFALVYYLFKSRGLKQGFMSVAYALLFFIAIVLVGATVSTMLFILFRT